MKKKYYLLGALVFLFTWQQLDAARWYVDANAIGMYNGKSWKDAFKGLQDGLDKASAGDTIWVASGTYYPVKSPAPSGDPRDVTFYLKDRVHIYGGFSGSEVELSDRRSDSLNLHVKFETILSGDIGTPNNASDNAYHIVISNNLSSFTLDGFTISGGFATDMTALTVGGNDIYRNAGSGIYNYETQGVYRHLVVRDNLAYSTDPELGGGGGMYNWEINAQGTLLVDQSIFVGNIAKNCNGGAMYNSNSSVNIKNSFFYKNEAHTDDEGGGAIDNREGSDCLISDVVFEGNLSTNSGGGIYNDGSKPKLTNVLFLKNQATGSCGGGMDTDGGSDAILNNVTFQSNYAAEDGGGLYGWKSSPTLNHVYFYDNYAANNGGGMYYYNTCKPVITNAIFMENSADNFFGGFGLERESEAVLTNVLFAKNTAINEAGGMGALGSNTKLIVTNATIANNSTKNGNAGGGYDMGSTTTLRNSIIAKNTPDDVTINPFLATLVFHSLIGDTYIEDGSVNPSGSTVTTSCFEDLANDDYRLDVTSMAIDLGDSNFYAPAKTPDLSSIKTDLNGDNRFLGKNVDLGAYERCAQILAPSGLVAKSPNHPVLSGSSITFTLTPKNAGVNPTFQWYKNGSAILGETSMSYAGTTGTDFNDKDTIWAMIYTHETCLSPTDTASAKAIVEICPQVLVPGAAILLSTGTLVPAGTPVSFSLDLNNVGMSPVIEWFKNGKKIPLQSGITYNATAGNNFADGDTIWATVVSSDPCAMPKSTMSNKVVMNICANVLIPSATISKNTGSLVPNGTNVTFTLSPVDAGSSPDIEWYKNSVLIAGQTTTTLNIIAGSDFNNGDTIWAKVLANDPCVVPNNAFSNKEIMSICSSTVIPTISISIDKPGVVPSGTVVAFSSIATDAGASPVFEWYKNGVLIPSISTSYYFATAGIDYVDGDSITAKLISSEPCAVPNNGMSNAITLSICANVLQPKISISITPQTMVPVGATVTFSVQIEDVGDNPTIVWYKNNTVIAGQNNAMTYEAVAGNDFVEGDSIWAKVISVDPCVVPNTVSSNKLVVEFCPLTLTPSATLSKDVNSGVFAGTEVEFVLTVNDAGATPTIEWFKNNVLIPSVNGMTYTAIAGTDFDNGDTIWARALASDPCALPDNAVSNKMVMTVFGLGVQSLASNFDIKLAPNPNSGNFVLTANFVTGANYRADVTDVLGRKVYSENFIGSQNSQEFSMPVTLTPGVYMLSIHNNEMGTQTIRFVIE